MRYPLKNSKEPYFLALLLIEVLIVKKPSISMESATIKKWTLFFIGILCAIIIADALSNIIVSAAGIVGWSKFLANFVLYTAFFFAILYAMEKIFHIEFFGFWRE
jgi:hypothetical protein